MNRFKDWLQQGKRDIEHAERSVEMGDFEWACFAAQQGAEKIVKALHMKLGTIAWGHSVFELLEGLPEDLRPTDSLMDLAKSLDKFYIPPRYPNAHPSGPSYKFYTSKEASEASKAAKEILKYCESKILETG